MRPLRLAVLALSFAALPAGAQSWTTPARFRVGASGTAAVPYGEFRDNVGTGVQGGGGNLTGLLRVDPVGVLSLRLDFGGVWYGSESQRVTLFSPRIGAEVVTTNSLLDVSVGPELAVPVGPIRPYANATVGVHAFSTSSSLNGVRDRDQYDDGEFSTNHQNDATFAYGFGAGVRVPVGPKRWDFALDLGTKYFRGGMAEYLTEGDIVDNPDGTLTLNTRQSRTDYQTFYVGFTVGLHSSPSSRRGGMY
jgi:hypothetical protein